MCLPRGEARYQKSVLSGKVKTCIRFPPPSPLPSQTKYNILVEISECLPRFSKFLPSSFPFSPLSRLYPAVHPLTESSRCPSACHWGSLYFGCCCSSSRQADLMAFGTGSWELSRLQSRKSAFICWSPLATDARGCLLPTQAAIGCVMRCCCCFQQGQGHFLRKIHSPPGPDIMSKLFSPLL